MLRISRSGFRGGGDKLHAVDVGWLELPEAAARASQRAFLPLSSLRPCCAHAPGSLALLFGFPGEPAELEHNGKSLRRHAAVPYGTRTLGADVLDSRFRDAVDTYIEYPGVPATDVPHGWRTVAPRAHGASGGGIWICEKPGTSLWSPDESKLVAIVRSTLDGEWVRGTQIQHWLRMVAEDVPELHVETEAFLRDVRASRGP
jgi:hypothetical protein